MGKTDAFLGQFKAYNPNAWCEKSCDPNFTDISHPCRGTLSTCGIPESENCTAEGRPKNTSCWRFSFRVHQQDCKASNGFMIQVQEIGGLGAGQNIETEMANQAGLKMFRTVTKKDTFGVYQMYYVAKAVQAWYDS